MINGGIFVFGGYGRGGHLLPGAKDHGLIQPMGSGGGAGGGAGPGASGALSLAAVVLFNTGVDANRDQISGNVSDLHWISSGTGPNIISPPLAVAALEALWIPDLDSLESKWVAMSSGTELIGPTPRVVEYRTTMILSGTPPPNLQVDLRFACDNSVNEFLVNSGRFIISGGPFPIWTNQVLSGGFQSGTNWIAARAVNTEDDSPHGLRVEFTGISHG